VLCRVVLASRETAGLTVEEKEIGAGEWEARLNAVETVRCSRDD